MSSKRSKKKQTKKEVEKAKIGAVQAGYSKSKAEEFAKNLIANSDKALKSINSYNVLAAERKRQYEQKARSGNGKRAVKYAEWANSLTEVSGRLSNILGSVPEFRSLAEAAAEGSYEEAKRYNARELDEKISKVQALMDERRQEAARLSGDARTDALNDIHAMKTCLDQLYELRRSGYANIGIGNTFNRKGYGKLAGKYGRKKG